MARLTANRYLQGGSDFSLRKLGWEPASNGYCKYRESHLGSKPLLLDPEDAQRLLGEVTASRMERQRRSAQGDRGGRRHT